MRLFERFRASRRNSAAQAKERLQVIIAHSRAERDAPEYLPRLKQELVEVIRKYVQVSQEDVKVSVERDGNYEILELNITLPK
ncbi:MAG: cell division topological specificity factor MinE [Gammaproteobacteria bacterium]|jgi:cell division topological specificity factor